MNLRPEIYAPVSEGGICDHVLEGARTQDVPAFGARARPDVDHHIRVANRVFVVFDDDQRVAEIAQRLQGRQQTVVVALMQADRRLV